VPPGYSGAKLAARGLRQLQLRPAGTRRGYYHMFKLARTIADLVCSESIGAAHVAQALQYRPRRVE